MLRINATSSHLRVAAVARAHRPTRLWIGVNTSPAAVCDGASSQALVGATSETAMQVCLSHHEQLGCG
jgi:hypothetical protein